MTRYASRILHTVLLLLCCCMTLSGVAAAQDGASGLIERAPVYLDGKLLFEVRGASAFPARQRANAILERVRAAATDPTFDPAAIELRETERGIELSGSGRSLLTVFDADARAEGLETRLMATVVKNRLALAIREYRDARSPEGIRKALKVVAIATIVFAGVMAVIVLLTRLSSRLISRHLKAHVETLERKSQNVVKQQYFWNVLQIGVRLIFVVLMLFALYYYVDTVLLALPWTHGFAMSALAFVSEPLLGLVYGFLRAAPDLIALIVIIVIAHYLLKLIRVFFERVRWGSIRLADFEPEWSRPTERLVRIAVIAFSIVMAYPYIPGSGSDAFKGLSIFAGVIFSLGSSSIIANIIAGYSIIYRRAFRVGDRVSICGVVGEVAEMRLLATHICTPKNERVTFPNSLVLNTQVVNYTMLAKDQGLILHTEVGIGYEVPWRKVEALLLEAAGRTPEVLKDPAPFVLQTRLKDFSPVYELNAYTHETKAIDAAYSALHANIQDVFMEHQVQIMTPNYEGDPDEAKIPPRDDWQHEHRPSVA